MKRIIISLAVIGAVAAIAIGATTAFFSDTETSTGNTFTAGAIDLKVDSECTYNGVASDQCGTWEAKDLVGDSRDPNGGLVLGDRFFNFKDVKPGDYGENTISLHVVNNDAWVCAEVSNLANAENGCNEPEGLVDQTCDNPGVGQGELQNALVMTVWKDDGVDGEGKCDNIQQEGERTLISGYPINGILPIYDSTTQTGSLAAGDTTCLGVSWSLPAATGNEVQTDSLTGDISFRVEQTRNNPDFSCVPVLD
jgi:predicted ribosomally synthesized peptide with SipW-like signal peptide